MNIVDIAIQAPELSTLVKLLEAAQLVDAVRNLRNSTLFAPTNEAFAKLPLSNLESLLEPQNRDQLKDILLTHVVPARALAGDLYNGQEIRSLAGHLLDVNLYMNSVQISTGKSSARVIEADGIAQNNVVVHIINNVLLPL